MAGHERPDTSLSDFSGVRSATPRLDTFALDAARGSKDLLWQSASARGCRSHTPTSASCLGPLARTAALDLHSRSTTAASTVRPHSVADGRGTPYSQPARPRSVAACFGSGLDNDAPPPRPNSVSWSPQELAPRAPAGGGAATPRAAAGPAEVTLRGPGGSGARTPSRPAAADYETELYSQLFRRPPPQRSVFEERVVLKSHPQAASRPHLALASAGPLGGKPRPIWLPTEPPAQVSAPTAHPHNSWCVVVQWVPPVDAPEDAEDFPFGYEVNFRSRESDHVMQVTGVSAEPFVRMQDLDPGRSYYFQVRARNDFGPGPWSVWSEAYEAPYPPEGPSGGTAAPGAIVARPATHADESDAAWLEWSEPCSHGAVILGYRVEYGPDPADEASIVAVQTSNNRTKLHVTGLRPNTVYYFRLCAINDAGDSDWTSWSEGLATRGREPVAPAAPQLHGEVSSRRIAVRWEPPESFGFPVERYCVRIAKDEPSAADAVEKHAASGGEQPELHFDDLVPGEVYHFQVRAESAMGSSEWSAWSAPVRTKPDRPGACGVPKVVANEHKKLHLEWDEPHGHGSDVVGYVLRWSSSPAFDLVGGSVEVPAKSQAPPQQGRAGQGDLVAPLAQPSLGSAPGGPVAQPQLGSPLVPMAQPSLGSAAGGPVAQPQLGSAVVPTAQPSLGSAPRGPAPLPPARRPPGSAPGKASHCLEGKFLPGEEVYFQVVAKTAAGNGEFSKGSEKVTARAHVPQRPEPPAFRERTSSSAVVCVLDTCHGSGKPVLGYEAQYDVDPMMPHPIFLPGRMRLVREFQKMGPNGEPEQPRLFEQVVNGLMKPGPYYFRVRAINEIGSSVWSPCSDPPLMLSRDHARGEGISRPGAPWLVDVEGATCLHIGFQPTVDLAMRGGGGLRAYEMRYARWPEALEEEDDAAGLQGGGDAVADAPIESRGSSKSPPGGVAVVLLVRKVCFAQLVCSPSLLSQFKARLREGIAKEAHIPGEEAGDKVKPDMVDLTIAEEDLDTVLVQCALYNLRHGAVVTERLQQSDLETVLRERLSAVSGIGAVTTGFLHIDSVRVSEAEPQLALSAAALAEYRPVRRLELTAPWSTSPQPVQVSGLSTGRAYTFQIRALTDAGPGPWSSASATFRTTPSAPDRPKPPSRTFAESNFSMELKMFLPEANGMPVTGCRLMRQGPNWSHRPQLDDWEEVKFSGGFTVLEQRDCLVERHPNPHWKELDATEAWNFEWRYNINGLPAGASFRWKVCCINEVGESEWSEPSEVMATDPNVPDQCPPPRIAVMDGGEDDRTPSSITLQFRPPFDGGMDITHYTLHWALTSRWEDGFNTVDNIAGQSYTVQGLEPNADLFVRVRAVNSIGPGRFSECGVKKGDPGAFQTLPKPPSSCRDLSIQAYVNQYSSVFIKWEKPLEDGGLPVSRYMLAWSLTPGMETTWETMKRSCAAFKLDGLLPGTDYYFDIRAGNNAGYGPPTGQPVHVHTTDIPPEVFIPPRQPKPPKLYAVDDGTSMRLLVTWTCNEVYDDKKGFIYCSETQTHMVNTHDLEVFGGYDDPQERIQFFTADAVEQLRTKRKAPNNKNNEFVVRDVYYGRLYQARVKASSDAGVSSWSELSDVVRMPCHTPSAPTALRCLGQTKTSLQVEWDGADPRGEPVTKYWVRIRQDTRWRGWGGGTPEAPGDGSEEQSLDEPEDYGQWVVEAALDAADVLHDWQAPTAPLPVGKRQSMVGAKYRWTVEGLDPACRYTAEVRAENLVGLGDRILLEGLETEPTESGPPGPPLAIAGTADPGSVTFGWKAPVWTGGVDIVGYDLCWLRVPAQALGGSGVMPQSVEEIVSAPGAKTVEVAASPRAFRAEGLRPADGAIAVVRSRNRVGRSAWSRCAAGAELDALFALPLEPAPIKVQPAFRKEPPAPGDYRPFSLSAHWTAPACNGREIRHFDLSLRRVDGGSEVPVKEFRVPVAAPPEEGDFFSLGFVSDGLPAAARYALVVRAGNEVGDSPEWSPASVEELAPPDKPRVPAAPWSDYQWPNAVDVLWKEGDMQGAPVEGCQLRRSRSADVQRFWDVPSEQCNKDLGERSIYVGDLDAKTGYHFQIRVRNVCGWSPWSAVSELVVTKASRPAVPRAPGVLLAEPFALEVCWTPPADHGEVIEEYEVALAGWDPGCAARLEGLLGPRTEAKDEELKRYVGSLPEGFEIDSPAPWVLRVDAVGCLRAVPSEGEQLPSHRFELPELGGCDFAATVRARNLEGWSDWSPALDGARTLNAVPNRCPEVKILDTTRDSFRCSTQLPWSNGERVERLEFDWIYRVGPMDRHMAMGGTVHADSIRPQSQRQGVVALELGPDGPLPATQRVLGGEVEVTVDGLEPGSEYDVRARAANRLGFSEWSFATRVVTAAGRPDKPGSIKKVQKVGNTVFYQNTKRHDEPEEVTVQAEASLKRRSSQIMDTLRRIGTPRGTSSRVVPFEAQG